MFAAKKKNNMAVNRKYPRISNSRKHLAKPIKLQVSNI